MGDIQNQPEPKLKITFQDTHKQANPPGNTMAAPFFDTLALTLFVKRLYGTEQREVTLKALLKASSLPRKNIGKAIGKALLPLTQFVHPDKLPEDDKDLGKRLFNSMRNPATGAIFKEIRAVARAEVWYRNAWVTAVVNSLDVPHESVQGLDNMGVTLNTQEQQREAFAKIREEREDDAEIADAAALLQSKLNAKFAKKQAAGTMCTDSTAIVIYTNTFLTGAIDRLRVGGATREDRAEIQRDIFKAVSHITSELNTPTRTQPVNTNEEDTESQSTASDDEDVPMDDSPASAPAAPLKRARDESDSDISVESSPTKRARKTRKSVGRGTPIADMGHHKTIINLLVYWALVLKPDNPARKCKAGETSSKTYFTTVSKVLQRNFPMEGTIDQESIGELTKESILFDKDCWPASKKNGDQTAQMRKLCAWGRFQDYIASLDQEEYEALLSNLPMTERKTIDVRFLGMDDSAPMEQ